MLGNQSQIRSIVAGFERWTTSSLAAFFFPHKCHSGWFSILTSGGFIPSEFLKSKSHRLVKWKGNYSNATTVGTKSNTIQTTTICWTVTHHKHQFSLVKCPEKTVQLRGTPANFPVIPVGKGDFSDLKSV